jgi:hypothetical protein
MGNPAIQWNRHHRIVTTDRTQPNKNAKCRKVNGLHSRTDKTYETREGENATQKNKRRKRKTRTARVREQTQTGLDH